MWAQHERCPGEIGSEFPETKVAPRCPGVENKKEGGQGAGDWGGGRGAAFVSFIYLWDTPVALN